MKQKKIPLRKCLGCNEMKPKRQLLRVVRNQAGEIKVDLIGKANGRGAYICSNKDCFQKAIKTKGFNRAFQCNIDDAIYEKLMQEIDVSEGEN